MLANAAKKRRTQGIRGENVEGMEQIIRWQRKAVSGIRGP